MEVFFKFSPSTFSNHTIFHNQTLLMVIFILNFITLTVINCFDYKYINLTRKELGVNSSKNPFVCYIKQSKKNQIACYQPN